MNEPNLTYSAHERFALLSEELCESGQIIGKIMRHGLHSYNPFDEEQTTNKELLEKEIGHVLFAVELLCTNHNLNMVNIKRHEQAKSESVTQYLHYIHEFPNYAPKVDE